MTGFGYILNKLKTSYVFILNNKKFDAARQIVFLDNRSFVIDVIFSWIINMLLSTDSLYWHYPLITVDHETPLCLLVQYL